MTRLSSPMVAPLLALALATAAAVAAADARPARSVERLLAAGSFTYEQLHEAAVEDQPTHYIEPIHSTQTRHPISLNGLYDFCFDPSARAGFERRWFERRLADTCRPGQLHRMPVPSAFNEILPNETAKNYMGWFWYQTELPLEGLATNQADFSGQWFMQFDNINYLAIVWAQRVAEERDIGQPAKLVGTHVGGHLPVVVELSDLLAAAANRDDERLRLTIAVSNQLTRDTIPSGQLIDLTAEAGKPLYRFQPDFDFFHFAGLMGDVQLVRLHPVHVTRVQFDVCGRELKLRVHLSEPLLDGRHVLLLDGAARYTREGPECHVNPLLLSIDCGSQWWRRRPVCQALAADGLRWPLAANKTGRGFERIRVQLAERLGANKTLVRRDLFEVKAVARARLEEPLEGGLQLQGFGMHHEQLFSGRTMSLAAIMKDLNLVKGLGANLLRTSHYPYSRAYLEACDELGIMVVAECAAVGLRSFGSSKLALHKQLLKEMMLRDHAHPSIAMWSVANEPQSQLAEARPYFESLLNYARTELLEFTGRARRPLTAAIAQSHRDDRIGSLLDVIMVNRYVGWYEHLGSLELIGPELRASLAGWAQRGKPLLVSEFGAAALVGQHGGEPFSEEYQRDLIEEHERLFDELFCANNCAKLAENELQEVRNATAGFLGAMIWNFADFSTHESLMRAGGNKKGIFTSDRRPKMAAESVGRIFRARAERARASAAQVERLAYATGSEC